MGYQKNQIERIATEVLVVTKQIDKEFIDIVAVADYFGLKIEEVIFENKNIAGMINFQDKLISIENKDKPYTKRLSIAKEIGRFVLHHMISKSDKEEDISFRKNTPACGYDVKDLEAEHFGLTLLMPEGKVRNLWGKYRNLFDVSKTLLVNQSSIALRLQYLGIE